MSRFESRLDKDLRFHIEQRTAGLIASRYDPAEARRLPRIEIGGPEQVKEQSSEGHIHANPWRTGSYDYT